MLLIPVWKYICIHQQTFLLHLLSFSHVRFLVGLCLPLNKTKEHSSFVSYFHNYHFIIKCNLVAKATKKKVSLLFSYLLILFRVTGVLEQWSLGERWTNSVALPFTSTANFRAPSSPSERVFGGGRKPTTRREHATSQGPKSAPGRFETPDLLTVRRQS